MKRYPDISGAAYGIVWAALILIVACVIDWRLMVAILVVTLVLGVTMCIGAGRWDRNRHRNHPEDDSEEV